MAIYIPAGYHQHPNGGGLVAETATVGAGATVSTGATVSAGARVGAWATVGAWARVGAGATIGTGARVGSTRDCVVINPLGSRDAPLTITFQPTIRVLTGCFDDSLEKFESRVHETYPEGHTHRIEYDATIAFIRVLERTRQ